MVQKKISKTAKALMVGSLVAGVGSLIYLYGTDSGKRKRKSIKSWSLRAKADIHDRLEKIKDVTEEAYNLVVDQVKDKYSKVKSVEATHLDSFIKEVKGNWKHIKRELSPKPAAKKKNK